MKLHLERSATHVVIVPDREHHEAHLVPTAGCES
jgi:hypothetical protein